MPSISGWPPHGAGHDRLTIGPGPAKASRHARAHIHTATYAEREPEQGNLRALNNAANTIAGRAESAGALYCRKVFVVSLAQKSGD
jgi:hypothetical protein